MGGRPGRATACTQHRPHRRVRNRDVGILGTQPGTQGLILPEDRLALLVELLPQAIAQVSRLWRRLRRAHSALAPLCSRKVIITSVGVLRLPWAMPSGVCHLTFREYNGAAGGAGLAPRLLGAVLHYTAATMPRRLRFLTDQDLATIATALSVQSTIPAAALARALDRPYCTVAKAVQRLRRAGGLRFRGVGGVQLRRR